MELLWNDWNVGKTVFSTVFLIANFILKRNPIGGDIDNLLKCRYRGNSAKFLLTERNTGSNGVQYVCVLLAPINLVPAARIIIVGI